MRAWLERLSLARLTIGLWHNERDQVMEFGMFHEFPSLPGRSESEAFDEAMEQVDAAERLGLDVMWLAELHFEPRRSLLSAPLSIASAIAARTKRIRSGSRCKYCRCATHCASPRRPRPSTSSATGG